jgi:mannose-1-phosphate guanylyltransferase/mannose-6-phosphate isomerase
MPTLFPIIMSGGAGTRLWPLSRQENPKQYHRLVGSETLLGATIARLGPGLAGVAMAPPTIVCNAQHAGAARGALDGGGARDGWLVLEPLGRNTAPVAAIAALHVLAEDPDGLLLLLPADHHIADEAAFRAAVAAGVPAAAAGALVTLGIAPDRPETGFGYIEMGERRADGAHTVAAFVEKPDAETAARYVASGRFCWNAGIFLFSAAAFLRELETHAPDMARDSLLAFADARREAQVLHLEAQSFGAIRAQSIDYAVMERTRNAAVIGPVAMGWSDVGSWRAVRDLAPTPAGGLTGQAVLEGCAGVLAHSDGPLIAAIGVKDLIIVATPDAVLVVDAERAQDVKAVVDELRRRGRTDLL